MRRRALAPALASAVALVMGGCTSSATPGDGSGGVEVVVLGAASLTGVLEELADLYEQEHPGAQVVLSTGGSSGLARQVVNGLPADLLVLASPASLQPVLDAGEQRGEPVVVARNRVEIVVAAGNPLGLRGLDDLARPELAVALCAVQVPCGAAAERAFRQAGLPPSPDTLEQDVRAVLTKVRLGEVDAGVVFGTDVRSAEGEVDGLPVDPPVRTDYPAVRLRGGSAPDAAQDLLDLLRSERGRALLLGAGFEVP